MHFLHGSLLEIENNIGTLPVVLRIMLGYGSFVRLFVELEVSKAPLKGPDGKCPLSFGVDLVQGLMKGEEIGSKSPSDGVFTGQDFSYGQRVSRLWKEKYEVVESEIVMELQPLTGNANMDWYPLTFEITYLYWPKQSSLTLLILVRRRSSWVAP